MRCLARLTAWLWRLLIPDASLEFSGDPIDEHHDASRPGFLPTEWHRARLDR